jgi:hypothetical protein
VYHNNLAPIYKIDKKKDEQRCGWQEQDRTRNWEGYGNLGRSQRLSQPNLVAFSFSKHKKTVGIPLTFLEARKLVWLQLQPCSQQMRVSWKPPPLLVRTQKYKTANI